MISPEVSVLMAVHNGERYLDRAIESILRQSFTDFEFIIVNDASTDASEVICRAYADKDSRIKIVTNKNNLGLAASLNLGLRESRGTYIARMDADDSSRSDRLKYQVSFLERHPEIGICGGAICYHRKGRRSIKRFYPQHELLEAELMFRACFSHPTVMFRRQKILNCGIYYDETFATTQDYEMWLRVLYAVRGANMPVILLDYYCHEEQTTDRNYDMMISNCRRIHTEILSSLVPDLKDDELMLHGRISMPHETFSLAELSAAQSWLKRLIRANRNSRRFDEYALKRVLFDMWRGVCYQSAEHGWPTFWLFWNSALSHSFRLSWSAIKLLIKCSIR
jgi:glycosyltransferase involved in cell wall biosynthesis